MIKNTRSSFYHADICQGIPVMARRALLGMSASIASASNPYSQTSKRVPAPQTTKHSAKTSPVRHTISIFICYSRIANREYRIHQNTEH